MPKYERLLALFTKHGQEHVFAGWDKLFQNQQEELLEDCARVDFSWLDARWLEVEARKEDAGAKAVIESAPIVKLSEYDTLSAHGMNPVEVGEENLRQGKVAAFTVAGGQGSRLGFAGPKGCFPIGPLSGKTLFQWHAERLRARSLRYGAAIPWYIMTSEDNDRDTRVYFEENHHFGLPDRDIFFFKQDMVPSLDLKGRLLLASPSRLAMNPSGHGGALPGLYRSGAIKNMRERGVELISYVQVDNPLAQLCDPLFLGGHVLSGSEMSCKVVAKTSPAERMGIVCLKNGRPAVVEYSDLDIETMEEQDGTGGLKFWAGSPAIHVLDVAFAERMGSGDYMTWHQARKKVPYFAGNRLINPDKENAIKFETFIFDALSHAEKSFNLEVRRESEFAPLKNMDGNDSVHTCRKTLSGLFCEWLYHCGITPAVVLGDHPDDSRTVVEISPLYSLDAEELATKIKPGGLKLERRLLLG